MRAFPAILFAAASLGLGGCASLSGEGELASKSGEFLSRSSEMLSTQGARLADLAGIGREDSLKQEVNALFEQPLIDPLTRYLQEHAEDREYAPYLPEVARERERRCEIIAQRFAAQAPTQENLQRLRRGYQFSCPERVQAFATKVNQATVEPAAIDPIPASAPSTAPAVGSSDAGPGSVTRRQTSNCYLLFSIRNYQQAAEACEKPAEAGNDRAQYNLARIAKINKEHSEAYRWASLAAAQDNADAQVLLAQLYQQGLGVGADSRKAADWLQRAARQEHPAALYGLALAYRQGQGVPADPKQMLVNATAAAERNHQPAQLLLASHYADTGDLAQSRKWLQRAAEQGSREGQYRLGESYASGASGQADPQRAYVWFSLALLNGEQKAQAKVEALSASLTPQQLQQAQASIQAQLKRR